MTLQELLSKLQEIQARLVLNLPKRLRPYFDALDLSARGLLVLGPRGVGKTTLSAVKVEGNALHPRRQSLGGAL
ncbi:hypothetical protein [Acetomicrobium sp.]|uniref:hypothetical protein n=1 Tax=Acetomicrobium sp. TaxID=1872099 RepID=UPI002871F007|nr:hypothetical protein [Acetomicrobium sp.]MDR9769379.1 hypothetical protein [Acetomicrobium sp.]